LSTSRGAASSRWRTDERQDDGDDDGGGRRRPPRSWPASEGWAAAPQPDVFGAVSTSHASRTRGCDGACTGADRRTSAANRDADAGNKERGAHARVVCRGARRAEFHTRHAERVDQGAGICVAHVARVGGRRLAAAAARTTPATPTPRTGEQGTP